MDPTSSPAALVGFEIGIRIAEQFKKRRREVVEKILSAIVIVFFSLVSQAQPSICLTEYKEFTPEHSAQTLPEDLFWLASDQGRMQCKDLKIMNRGLQVTLMTVGIVSAGAGLCVGGQAGAIVGAAAGVTAALLGYMSFEISDIECTDQEKEEILMKRTQYIVCEALQLQGIQCDAEKIKLEKP
jgi:hypothetical protein